MPDTTIVNNMINRIDYHQRYVEKRKWSGIQTKTKCFVCGNICHFYWSPALGVEWIKCCTPDCIDQRIVPEREPIKRAVRTQPTLQSMVSDIKRYKPRRLF